MDAGNTPRRGEGRLITHRGYGTVRAYTGDNGQEYVLRRLKLPVVEKHVRGALRFFAKSADCKAGETLGMLYAKAIRGKVSEVIVHRKHFGLSDWQAGKLEAMWATLPGGVKLTIRP